MINTKMFRIVIISGQSEGIGSITQAKAYLVGTLGKNYLVRTIW